jgi:hypothetical protein
MSPIQQLLKRIENITSLLESTRTTEKARIDVIRANASEQFKVTKKSY